MLKTIQGCLEALLAKSLAHNVIVTVNIAIVTGNSNNALTSNDSTTSQPTRRPRFKPKVGIVASAQKSPGKTSNQIKSTTEAPRNASQPSTSTKNHISPSDGGQTSSSSAGITPVSKGNGGHPRCSKSSAGVNTSSLTEPRVMSSRPSTNSNQITVTATVHSPPAGTRNSTSPLSGVPACITNNTKPVKAIDQIVSFSETLPSTGEHQPSTDKDITPVNKNIDDQPPPKNDTLPVNKNGTTTKSSSGGERGRVSVTVNDQISTSADNIVTAESAGIQALGHNSTAVEKNACLETNITGNSTAATKPVRRAKIRPRVGLISAKTPAGKSSTKTPVETTTPSPKTAIFPASVTTPPMNAGTRQPSTNTDKESTNIFPTGKITNTHTQPLTSLMDTTGTTSHTLTESENVEESSIVVGETSNSSKEFDKTSSLEALNGSPTERTSKNTEKGNQALTNTASSDANNSSFEQSKSIVNSASSQVTRRARFKPRVGVVGRPRVAVRTTQAKPDAVDKQETLENMATNNATSKERLETSKEARTDEQNNVSLLRTNIENEQPEIRDHSEPDEVHPTRNENLTEQNEFNPQQTESCGDPESLHDSLEDVMTLPQHNELVEKSAGTSLPSCVPVLTADHSILPQGHVTSDELPSSLEIDDTFTGLGIEYGSTGVEVGSTSTGVEVDGSTSVEVEDGAEQSTEMNAVVDMGADISHFFHFENAEDLLQSLISVSADYGPAGRSDIPVDTDAVPVVDMDRLSVDTTAANVHADPNRSTPSPAPNTSLEKESSTQGIETVSIESRTLPQSDETGSSLSERQLSVANDQAETASRLVTKRQRGRPKRNQCSSPIEAAVLDISTIPIASNIEIEAEVSTCEDIDHPVLELPDDLIEEDLTQPPRETTNLPGGLEQRFQQRRSGTVKLVLFRKKSTVDRSGADEGNSSTTWDKNDTPGSTERDTEKSREVARKARPRPNIQIRRKTGSQRKSSAQNKIFPGVDSVDNADVTSSSADVVLGFQQERLVQKQHSIPHNNQKESSNDLVRDDISKNIEISFATSENIAAVCDSEIRAGLETENGIVDARVEESAGDVQCEVEIHGAHDSSVVNNLESGNTFEFQSFGDDTNVDDLSRENEIEIVMEVAGTTQECSNAICESATAVPSSDAGLELTKMTDARLGDDIDASSIHTNVSNECEITNTTSSLPQSSNAVHSQKNTVDVISLDNLNGNCVTAELTFADNDQTPQCSDEVITTNGSPSETSVNIHGGEPRNTTEENRSSDGQTNEISTSASNLTVSESDSAISGSTPTTRALSSFSESTAEETTCTERQSVRLLRSKNKDLLTSKGRNNGVVSSPKSSSPLHDVSLVAPENAFQLVSDVEFNCDSQSNCVSSNPIQDISLGRADGALETTTSNHLEPSHDPQSSGISTDEHREDTNPISSPQIQDISLNIPESAIEAAIRNTTGPLPDIVECPECPELLLCLTTDGDSSIHDQAQDLSQTQPGTLEDNVVRATRRASQELEAQDLLGREGPTASEKEVGSENQKEKNSESSGNGGQTEPANGKATSGGADTATNDLQEQVSGKKARTRAKPKPNTQRKRKARGKMVDDEGSEDTAGGNNGSSIQENHGDNIGSVSDAADLRIQDETSVGSSVPDNGSLVDTCVQDGSSGDRCVQPETTRGLEETSSQVEPAQEDTNKKTNSRKRQGKAVKPKIPAKRTRKKTGTVEADANEGCDGNEQEPGETAVSIVVL